MNVQTPRKRHAFLNRILSALIAFIFSSTTILPPRSVQAQTFLNLPVPGSMVTPTAGFIPPLIKGLTIYPNNPLEFNFIVDSGQSGIKIQAPEFRTESRKLIKYFLAALTIPDEDLWVNLSPYEKDRVISAGFGQTEMGRDLLAQDYLLKQLMASLTYPEDELGKNFWEKVYAKARQLYGAQDIPVNTFNKIWIVPDKAVVYEIGSTAYVIKTHLKVMLEGDYLALKENMNNPKLGLDKLKTDEAKQLSDVSSAIVKEVLIPEIEKEVNEGKTFANLRQIYNSMVLATWYKKNLKESLLGQVYVNKSKIKGVDLNDKTAKEKIYQQYLDAFKKGVYSYIKEDTDPVTQKSIPRKYFSGGAEFKDNIKLLDDGDDAKAEDFAQLSDTQENLFVSAWDEPLAQASQNDQAAEVKVNLIESPEDSKKMDELKVSIQEGEQRKEEELQQKASTSQDKTATQETTDTTTDPAALTPEDADRQITNLLAQTAKLAQNLLEDSNLLDAINALDLEGIEQKLAEAERSLGRDSRRAQAGKGILQVIMALKSKDPRQIENALQDAKRNTALSSGTIQMLGELIGGPQINDALNQIIEILRGETDALLEMDPNTILDLSQAINNGETTLGRESQRAAMGRILLDIIGSFRASPWNKEAWDQIVNKFGEMESIASSRMLTRFRELIADHAIARVGDQIFKILNEIGSNVGSLSNEASKIEELRELLTSIEEFMQRDSQRIALYQNLLNIIERLHLGNWTQSESAFSAIITSGLIDARGLASLRELIAEVRITKAYGEMQEIMEAAEQNEEILLEISKERIQRIRNDLLNAQEFRGRPSGRVAIAQPILDELERAAGTQEVEAQEDQLSPTSPEELQNWQDQLDEAMRRGDMDRLDQLLGGDLDQGEVGDDPAALTDLNFPEENRHDFESWGEDTYNLLWNTVETAPQEWVIKLQSKNISSFRLEGVQDVNQLQKRIQTNSSFIGNRWLAIGGPFHIYILEDEKEIIIMDRFAYAHHEFPPNTRAWVEELDQAVRKNNVDEITRLLGAEEDLDSTDQAFLRDSSATDDMATLKATVEVGGIDLNPKLLDLQIKRDGNGVPLPLPQQPIGSMNIQGFLPIIVDVIPFSPIFTGKIPLGLSLNDRNSPLDSAKGRPVENFRYIDPSLFSQSGEISN